MSDRMDDMAEVERLGARMIKRDFYVMFRRVVDPAKLKPAMLAHYRWIIGLEKQGVVFLSGPVFRQDGSPGVGMTVFRAADFAAADALLHVAGYTAANDLSARDWVRAVWQAEKPWEARLTWEVNIMGKQLPGFTALGPAITTTDEIADPAPLTLTTLLNGAVMQHAEASDLIFPVAEVIAYLSRWYTFQPGDVLLTGTPAGVGVGRKPPVFLRDGDLIEVRIDRIGTLATRFAKQR